MIYHYQIRAHVELFTELHVEPHHHHQSSSLRAPTIPGTILAESAVELYIGDFIIAVIS